MNLETCPDCGVAFPPADVTPHKYLGGSTGCWAAFNEVLAREFQDINYFAVHRFTVDAYTAQHPGDQTDRRAAQSVNIHLTAIYVLLEENRDAAHARTLLAALANNMKGAFQPLTPPAAGAYAMTVKDVLAAKNAREHCALVNEWVRDVWRAWAHQHEVIKSHARAFEQMQSG